MASFPRRVQCGISLDPTDGLNPKARAPKRVLGTRRHTSDIRMTVEPNLSKDVTFLDLGLSSDLVHRVESRGFTIPTPIQEKAIPIVLTGADLIGIAQTGTGKTFAFGLPLLEKLKDGKSRVLVVVPTRELATQIVDALEPFLGMFNLKSALLIGGTKLGPQRSRLLAKPALIVGTPGRILDHVKERHLELLDITHYVLDEADRMLDLGFRPVIESLTHGLKRRQQTLLFSATLAPEVEAIARGLMKNPQHVSIAAQGRAPDQVDQKVYMLDRTQKQPLLDMLLKGQEGPVLIFTRTRRGAQSLTRRLKARGHRVGELHADRSQNQRDSALNAFRSGESQILVATDIASRGIDVIGISLVVNYDVPNSPEDYVHRIGRTGRAGREGSAVTLATDEESKSIREIEKLMKRRIPIARAQGLPAPIPQPVAAAGAGRTGAPRGAAAPARPAGSRQLGASKGPKRFGQPAKYYR